MQSRQRVQLYLLITSMAISAVIITISAAKGLAQQKGRAAVRDASLSDQSACGYVLGECGGHLALYRENSAKPYRILDMEVYLLSDADRQALAEGIVVRSEAELNRILQDWDSD
ncbi:MAG: hypothetical protein IJN11_10705 [Oscillospiraceae bacterium]|nr:hypothetical protein [Ruminococcus sp.]MBQ3256787.1 hypothetical protein [Oscillospiraceae bacterium]MBQ7014365.1 hypothetical protein [Oscillospiraceae bacterium]